MKNKIIAGIVIVFLLGGIATCYILKNKNSASSESTDVINTEVNTDDDDEKIDWSNYEDTDYTLTKSITITKAGVYNLTGTISNGCITINTSGVVKLVLNNVNISNQSGPAIIVENAEDVVISLAGASVNTLSDGSSYTADDIGVIFSHSDLTFEGTGTLNINANNEDGIVSTDDLKFVSGTYNITSEDDGIRGKDSVYIEDGTFNITSKGDGIKSTNEEDSEKGFIKILNGTFNIDSILDGITAVSKMIIENGTFNITTGIGSSITSSDSTWGNWNSNSSSTQSAKGLKSGDSLVISNGTFVFDTSDDAIHSNNYVGIKNGNITITSGDDGIHADESLIIDGGTINIKKSYEGLEANKITINDGTISVVASDDGINVAGGNDSSSMGGRPGQNNMGSSGTSVLTINGGNITVNATGDGLDANGSIYITGGNTVVYGPTNDGNGALDYDSVCQVTGGTLTAGGSSGMLQSPSSSSTVNNVTIVFTSNYTEGDVITITDSNGKTLITYTGNKTFNSLVIATNSLVKGNTYNILVNGEKYSSFTVSSTSTTVGSVNNGMNNRGGRR